MISTVQKAADRYVEELHRLERSIRRLSELTSDRDIFEEVVTIITDSYYHSGEVCCFKYDEDEVDDRTLKDMLTDVRLDKIEHQRATSGMSDEQRLLRAVFGG